MCCCLMTPAVLARLLGICVKRALRADDEESLQHVIRRRRLTHILTLADDAHSQAPQKMCFRIPWQVSFASLAGFPASAVVVELQGCQNREKSGYRTCRGAPSDLSLPAAVQQLKGGFWMQPPAPHSGVRLYSTASVIHSCLGQQGFCKGLGDVPSQQVRQLLELPHCRQQTI